MKKKTKKVKERYCVKWGCEEAPLVFLKIGEHRQTANGFLIAKIDAWYCPNCAAGYGGEAAAMAS